MPASPARSAPVWLTVAATWCYLGKSPVVPGTLGTVGALPLLALMATLPHWSFALVTALVCIAAVVIAEKYEAYLQRHDASEIVIDEVAGLLVCFLWLPITWQTAAVGFVVFRIFDMSKPWPISLADRKVSGGFGVVLDDVLAGFASNAVLQLLLFYWPATLGVTAL